MQNVLLQMGLRLTTPTACASPSCGAGCSVPRLRGRHEADHAGVLAKCGNATLQKVQHTVGEAGRSSSACGGNTRSEARASRFPRAQGRPQEKAPILREDQLIGMRGVKKRDDEDVFAAEYNEESFAGSSRGQKPGAAHLYHQRDLVESGGFPKKNPNERRFVRTNRRRKQCV